MGREDPLPGARVRVSPNPRRISRMVRLRPRFVMLESPVMVRPARFSPQISSKNPDSRSSLLFEAHLLLPGHGLGVLGLGDAATALVDDRERRVAEPIVR